MYELVQISENSYYIECPAKIGVVKINENEVCLIDSGNDKDAGKKINKILAANGWKLTAIYNTHSHADHIGGNRYLQTQTGCKIYAPGIECDFTNHPILEPAFLYGGNPPGDLRHKFLMANECNAERLEKEDMPQGMEIISLPGHSYEMVGFRTLEDVVYLADCLSSKETLDKYQIGFIYDVGAYIQTLEMVKNMKAKMFVPSHAQPTEEITELAQININKVAEIGDKIVEICKEPRIFEEILQSLFTDYGLKMNFEQYVLVGSTVKSYLTWLRENERIKVEFQNNKLVFYK